MTTDLLNRTWEPPTTSEWTGESVHLARLAPAQDSAGLYAISHGSDEKESIWKYLPYGPFASPQAMHDWLESIAGSQDPLFYTVHRRETQQPVGMVSILNIVPQMGRAELGHIWYGREAQKTGVNTETIFLLLRYLFEELHYRRVEWKCNNHNEESKRAALRLGFTPEGLFRQHMVVKGCNRDTAWFSILDSEWDTLRNAFERYFASPDLALTALTANRQGAAQA